MWFLALLACGSAPNGPTYHADTRPILERKCVGCHRTGSIGPFALDTYQGVVDVQAAVAASIASGTMPPWQAEGTCNTYANSIDLTDDERAVLLEWLDTGAAEGDPETAAPLPEPPTPFVPDVLWPLPESYTPAAADDYRCQLIDPAITEASYVTGFVAQPDKTEVVHHVIAYRIGADDVPTFQQMDAQFDGPGWPCYGGPTAPGFRTVDIDITGLSISELVAMLENGDAIDALGGFGWLGSWAPGGFGAAFPEGTGLRIEPGDQIAVQMHYNTLAGTAEDRSSIGVTLASEVERPAMVMPYTNPAWVVDLPIIGPPMTIPAGAPDTTHSYGFDGDGPLFDYVRNRLDLPGDSPLLVRSVAHHMHTLGTAGNQTLLHADGTETCLVDIASWDFDWQARYIFDEPVMIGLDDELMLSCSWDNTAANQLTVDGQRLEPQDVEWGEGTRDEMCLGILYLTAP